jgi:hypothetical protein
VDSTTLSESDHDEDQRPKFTPVAFHDACVRRLEKALGTPLAKRSRASFAAADRPPRVICAVSGSIYVAELRRTGLLSIHISKNI